MQGKRQVWDHEERKERGRKWYLSIESIENMTHVGAFPPAHMYSKCSMKVGGCSESEPDGVGFLETLQ